jgi:sugar lactone lactonase YvrE
VDGGGNAFVTDVYENQVLEVAPGGAISVVPLGLTLNSPYGIALDAAGALYIADAGNNRIVKLPYGSATAAPLNLIGLDHPEALAVDGAGNVFIANTRLPVSEGTGSVIEFSASGTQTTLIDSTLNYPSGVAVDAAGDVFIADKYNNRVVELRADGVRVVMGGVLSVAAGVAVDGAGDVFIADQNNGRVVELPDGPGGAGSGAQTVLATSLLMPNALALDAHGNVFVASIGSGNISGNVVELQMTNALQTISFGPIAPQTLGSSPVLAASASSGLPVSYVSKTPAVCTVSGSTVTLIASGTCTILASQIGSAMYLPAAAVAQSFSVLGSGQTLTATFTISSGVTLSAPVVFTEGVPSTTLASPDFTLVSSGTTCMGLVTGTCAVNVKFTPQYAGLRRGAVKLMDVHNNLVATAYISGVGANPQTPFTPGPAQTIDGFGPVAGTAVDGAGHVFFVAGLIYKTVGGKSIPVPLGTTLHSPFGLALDAAGNLFIADAGNNRVLELPYGSSTAQALDVTGLNYPQAVAVDGAGNILIANTRGAAAEGDGTVVQLSAGAHTQSTVIGNGLTFPNGLTIDAAGDLFVADWGAHRVLEVSAAGAWTSIGAGLGNTTGVVVDGWGDLFILDATHNQVVEVAGTSSGAGTGAQTTVITGMPQPRGIALDGSGDLFISNLGTSTSLGNLVEVPQQ